MPGGSVTSLLSVTPPRLPGASSIFNSSSWTQNPFVAYGGPPLRVRVNSSWLSRGVWMAWCEDVREPGEMEGGTWDEWWEGSTGLSPENWVPDLAQPLM